MQKNDTFENGLQNVRRIRKTFLSHFWSTICYNEIKKKQKKERTRKKELERKNQKERTRKKELERKNQKERTRKKEPERKKKYSEINEKRDLDIPYTG